MSPGNSVTNIVKKESTVIPSENIQNLIDQLENCIDKLNVLIEKQNEYKKHITPRRIFHSNEKLRRIKKKYSKPGLSSFVTPKSTLANHSNEPFHDENILCSQDITIQKCRFSNVNQRQSMLKSCIFLSQT